MGWCAPCVISANLEVSQHPFHFPRELCATPELELGNHAALRIGRRGTLVEQPLGELRAIMNREHILRTHSAQYTTVRAQRRCAGLVTVPCRK